MIVGNTLVALLISVVLLLDAYLAFSLVSLTEEVVN